LEHSGRKVQNRVEVAIFQEFLTQFNGGVIGVGQEGILDDNTGVATCFEVLDEVFQEEVRRFSGLDGEVLLDLLTLAGVFVLMIFGDWTPWRIMFIMAIRYGSAFFSLP